MMKSLKKRMMSKSGMKKVSVVIRCFNEETHIEKLFQGVRHQSIQPVEIIVVDSGSTDGTLEIAAKYTDKIFHIQPEKFSFGYSLNLGISNAGGDIVIIISAHAYPVYEDWLEKMVGPFEEDDVALVYGRQYGDETSKYSERMWFKKCFPEQSNREQKSPFCNNANSAIRRSLWEKYKYDEILTGLEDIDWAKKVFSDGYRIVYQADAPIFHIHDEAPARIYNRYRREAIALKKIYPETRFTIIDLFVLTSRNIINDWFHASRDKLLWQHFIDIIVFRSCQFLGTYHGHTISCEITSELRNKFYYPPTPFSENEDSTRNSSVRIDYTAKSRDK